MVEMDNKTVFKKNYDLIFGLIVVLSSIALLLETKGMNEQVALFPVGSLVFILFMGVGIAGKSIYDALKGKARATKITSSEVLAGVIAPGGILLIASLLIEFAGFYVVTFAFIIALMFLQDKVSKGKFDFTLKRIVVIIVFSAVVSIVMYIIFNILLRLATPKGIFGF
jgi:asparagine N-glycosylation enzyme membrane subunit Stt3